MRSENLMDSTEEKQINLENGVPLQQNEPTNKHHASDNLKLTVQDESKGFDEALEYAGSWGRWQKVIFVVTYLGQVFCAMHAVSAVFLSATPEHWCKVPGLDPGPDLDPNDLRNLTIPWDSEDGFSKCEYYNIQDFNQTLANFWNNKLPYSELEGLRKSQCSSWEFDHSVFRSTLVSEFSLVCGRLWLKASVQASYMSGLLLGSLIMGQLSDSFGRRTMTVICTFTAIVIGIAASFVNSFIFFILMRFALAFFNAGIMVITFVLLMEVVKPGARTFVGMMCAFFFGCGITILPGIAYFIRDWRYLQLAISIANGILVIYFWVLPESPRWLASQGRAEEALEILKKIAKTNGKHLPPDDEMTSLISCAYCKQKPNEDEKSNSCLSSIKNIFCGQLALIRTPVMRRRCLISFFIWFVAASAYYGLIFSGGNIKADIFLMIFVSGIVEIPSSLIAIAVMTRLGRRMTMFGLFIACGSCCLLVLAVPQELIVVNFVLVNLGKFFDTAVFQQSYLYTSELVPTTVRNIAVGTSSMFARVGCVITPFVIELLGELHYALPSTLFGILSIAAGLLTLFLPETNNKKLPETIEEVEEMDK